MSWGYITNINQIVLGIETDIEGAADIIPMASKVVINIGYTEKKTGRFKVTKNGTQ